ILPHRPTLARCAGGKHAALLLQRHVPHPVAWNPAHIVPAPQRGAHPPQPGESRMSTTIPRERTLEATTMRRVSWRLMPFLLLAYLICYIDRVNVGFAALQMNKAVGIDPKTFGLGAGIFFIGYFILEVPSNLALERFGARKRIARILITWGLASGGFALIGGPNSFLVLRFLLGAAEAAFFPGVTAYLTYWLISVYRAP